MKLSVYIAALVVFAATSATAFADGTAACTAVYTGSSSNETEVAGTADYSSVMITKVPDNADQTGNLDSSRIVYADQVDGTFTDALKDFLIKASPSYGKYKVQLGSSTGDAASTYFYIGVDKPDDDIAMVRVGEKNVRGYWRVGYSATVTPEQYNGCNSIKVAFDSNPTVAGVTAETVTVGGYNLKEGDYPSGTVASGSGEIQLVFQINDVPNTPQAYKDSITVFLSSELLTNALVFE